ncbi:MAG TPA: Error-prone repair protein ImuA [Chitinophagaceae bacterium]
MLAGKADMIARLQQDILLLQGFKPAPVEQAGQGPLGLLGAAFPNGCFPVAAIHEFCCGGMEAAAATCGFIAGIVSALMKNGPALWISPAPGIYPPALKFFGIEPHRILFAEIAKEQHARWAMEEALKCGGLSAVVAEIREFSFTESRRFQLAVEHSDVTGFIVRHKPKNLATTAVTRWQVTPLAGSSTSLPGLGFPRWNVELLKVRNGKPGSWPIEWNRGRFRFVQQPAKLAPLPLRKIG